VTARTWTFRLAALLGAGTFAVHQARYALGYRGEASRALADQGHAYLIAAGPIAACAVMLALAALVRRVARGTQTPSPRLRVLWPAATLALVATYAVQESVEGALAAHHPIGAAGVVGHGGWLALPLAALVGLAVALAMRGARAAADLTAVQRPWRTPRLHPPRAVARTVDTFVAPRRGAPSKRTARGPPLLAA
jgi:hypothetical protein